MSPYRTPWVPPTRASRRRRNGQVAAFLLGTGCVLASVIGVGIPGDDIGVALAILVGGAVGTATGLVLTHDV